jgi:hypothetical protein
MNFLTRMRRASALDLRPIAELNLENQPSRFAGARRTMSFIGVLEAVGKDFAKGLGQPGRLHQLEARVSINEEGIQKVKGFVAAFGIALTMVHLAIALIAAKHI